MNIDIPNSNKWIRLELDSNINTLFDLETKINYIKIYLCGNEIEDIFITKMILKSN